MYPNVLREISNVSWAMYPDAFTGILRGVEGTLSFTDYELFHKLDEQIKNSTLDFLGKRVPESRYSRIEGKTGSIFIDGPIIPRATGFADVSGLTSIDVLTKEFLAFEANGQVDRILLVIDTPGGSVTGLSEFVQVIRACTKPVEALTLGLMASAGYWIGSAADKIYSVDTGLIGSIGTILTLPNPDDSTTVIVSDQSPNKHMDVTTKEGMADAKRIVNDLAALFINSVAENRGIKAKVVLSHYGKGAVFVAQDALIRGMIDGIVSLRDYMAGVLIKTNLEEKPTTKTDQAKTTVVTKTTKQEKTKMKTLAELLADFPHIATEIAALEAKAKAAGFTAARTEIQQVVPFLTSEEYGTSIKQLACRALTGESNVSALESAVAVIDEMRTNGELTEAIADTEAQGESNAHVDTGSTDGSINTEEDFDASLAAQRAQL